jgi:hypothetical protein
MDPAEATRCPPGSGQSDSGWIEFAQQGLHLKRKRINSRVQSIPMSPVLHPACRLTADPIGPQMGGRPTGHSAILPIPTVAFCRRERDSLLATTVSLPLMRRTRS